MTGDPQDPPTSAAPQRAVLEVVVLHPRDAAAATEGGADRLLVLTEPDDGVGRSPDPAGVSAVVRESELPVRVLLRTGERYAATQASYDRLVDLAGRSRELGAAGFSFGFLDDDLRVDRAACAALAAEVAAPWTFHRGFDAALEPERGWRDVIGLPGLDSVASAGSPRGMAAGGEELTRRAAAAPGVAGLLLACGASPDQVPWLVRAGVRGFRVGRSVRPDRSWTKAYVDPAHVRTWRMLLDDAVDRALGVPLD